MGYSIINKPFFTPPAIVFPIVWIILYTLMGISSYIIFVSDNPNKKSALILYTVQLLLNILWPFWFFNLQWFLFAFIWLIGLLICVIIMIINFYKINKVSAFLQIPYVIWLVFAGILNLGIYILN